MSTPPILLPGVSDFAELMEYVSEWDYDCMNSHNGEVPRPDLVPRARYVRDGVEIPHDEAFTPSGNRRYGERAGNEVGPFCSIDMRQLGGPAHRSIAVRATDATIEAVRDRLVTDDDHLSFRIIGALVVLQHGYIIGSHWLALVDSSTIPPYPHEARDRRVSEIRAAMEEAGMRPVVYGYGRGKTKEPHSIELRDGHNAPPTYPHAIVHADGSVTRWWPDGTVSREPTR